MNDEVLLSKAESIERCVARERSVYLGREAEFLDDYDLQDIAVLNILRACEQCIDMANRLVALRRLRYPKDSKDSFKSLAEARLLPRPIAEAMQGMVGFRNVAVHEYQALDIEKVRRVIEHRLDDLLAFSRAVLEADPSP